LAKIQLIADLDEKLLEQEIVKQISGKINSILSGMKNDGIVKAQLDDFIDRQVKNSKEFSSIIHGELKSVFGLSNPEFVVTSIISQIKKNLSIEIELSKVINRTITAGITVGILRDDFQDLLSTDFASYRSKGGDVNWLEWLLVRGDEIILSNYTIESNLFGTESRTGNTLMVKSNKGFRVPPEYAGNVHNNWLTRCFDDTEEIVGNILTVEFLRRL